MSTTIKHTSKGAVGYNARTGVAIWGGQLESVPMLLDEHPGLRYPADSVEFMTAVKGLQRDLFGRGADCDGMLGRGTWSAALKKYDLVQCEDAYWVYNDRRLAVDTNIQIINFDQDGGLDLHRVGHFSRRSAKPTQIVVHWGGLDPKHCHRVFSDPTRKVSSHMGIGVSDTGRPTAYQYLDLQHKAWHAGSANTRSIGIDICQQPGLKWAAHYRRKGYDLEVINNETGRGPARVMSIDPRVAEAVRESIKTLCAALDIPYRCPRGDDGLAESGEYYHGVLSKKDLDGFAGVVGHHHITAKKWDCACWWDQIWDDNH